MFRGKAGSAPNLLYFVETTQNTQTLLNCRSLSPQLITLNYLMKLEIESHSSILAAECLLTRL